MLEALSSKLKSAVDKLLKSGADREAIESVLTDIEKALISGDVNVKLAKEFSENIRKKAFDKVPSGLTRKEFVLNLVYDELTKILGGIKPEISLRQKKILLVGLFGSGKTSSAAKIARWYQKKGLKPMLICCDVVRPAAYEQLEQLAKKIGADFYGEKGNTDASKVLKNALQKTKGKDVIIVDSSGRDALDDEMRKEILSLHEILKADERILVLPADIGQAVLEQAKAFHDLVGITDVIVTKLDATAKGGGALVACYESGAKIKFITTGEDVDSLEIYDPKKFLARLLGMPDIETLIEKAQAALKPETAAKIITADFTLEDFLQQMSSVQQMGPLSQMTEMLGLRAKIPKEMLEAQEKKIKKWEHIIKSMTPVEKTNPDVINPSRVKRIAQGSGATEADVRDLISQYEKSKKMIKKLGVGKMRGKMDMRKLMGNLKGMGI